MNVAPVRAWTSASVAARAGAFGSQNVISAPYARTASIFGLAELSGWGRKESRLTSNVWTREARSTHHYDVTLYAPLACRQCKRTCMVSYESYQCPLRSERAKMTHLSYAYRHL